MRSTLALRAAAILIAGAAAVLTAAPAAAQKSTTRGFTLGAHLQGASLKVEDGDRSSGGGAGLRVGYGFNRNFALYLEADGTQFDVENSDFGGEWSMGHADLGVRYSFANSLRRWVPFLEAAVGGRAVRLEDATVDGDSVGELDFSGGALSVGGGIGYFLSEKLALETLVKFSGGTFEQIDIGNVSVTDLDIDASSFRFKVGIAWWP
ncbi:MAG TPA: outer membrane beta-barrel protein [Longimicrobiales bacterium]